VPSLARSVPHWSRAESRQLHLAPSGSPKSSLAAAKSSDGYGRKNDCCSVRPLEGRLPRPERPKRATGALSARAELPPSRMSVGGRAVLAVSVDPACRNSQLSASVSNACFSLRRSNQDLALRPSCSHQVTEAIPDPSQFADHGRSLAAIRPGRCQLLFGNDRAPREARINERVVQEGWMIWNVWGKPFFGSCNGERHPTQKSATRAKMNKLSRKTRCRGAVRPALGLDLAEGVST
jgi:hypothetical protein